MGNTPMVDERGYIDVNSALRLKEAEGKVEVEKLKAEADAKFKELLIKESAKETASKHLAKFAGLYLLILVLAFIVVLNSYLNLMLRWLLDSSH